MNIFLIGFMGSGKSTLGKKIAKKLDLYFVDLDLEIEKEQDMSISQIFQERGEKAFRELETEWLNRFDGENYLISLGGGTACFNSNIDMISQMGISVYLKMSEEALIKRLLDSKTKRPMIEAYKNDREQLQIVISRLLSERETYYNQAKIIFEATNMSKSKTDELVKIISTYA
jgi:shikimate kinase